MREWLAAFREEKQLTHEDIAKAVNISRGAYTNIETGKRRPSPEVARRISDMLGFEWTRFYEDQTKTG